MTKYGHMRVLELGTGIALPGTHPASRRPYPGYTPPADMVRMQHHRGSVSPGKYGRGAQIGSPTLFICLDLKVQRVYRGL